MPISFATSINPWTTDKIRDWSSLNAKQIDDAVNLARTVQASWAQTPVDKRADGLKRMAKTLTDRREELASLAVAEMGKPLTQSLAEVDKCGLLCEHYAGNAEHYLASQEVPSPFRSSRVDLQPLGTILSITPWNFPFWQILRFAVPTLIVGNTVVVKPAPNVLGCAEAVRAIVDDCLGVGILTSLPIDHDQVATLIGDDRIAGVALTGSGKAGRAVAALAGQHLKPCLLELGGSDPMIVLPGADPEATSHAAADARFSNSGQVCIASKRLIVLDAGAGAFKDAVVEQTMSWQPQDPSLEDTKLGPMARGDLRETLHHQQQKLIHAGAVSLLEGGPLENAGFSFAPSVLQLEPNTKAGDEELFGPVLLLQVVETIEQAIALANDTPYGLSASVWGQDLDLAEQVAAQIEAGSVYINTKPATHPAIPMGGIKSSGFGRELGREGVAAFANLKTIVHG